MKWWVYLAILVVGGSLAKWIYDSIYDAGWNAAVIEQRNVIIEKQQEAVAAARLEWEATAEIAEAQVIVEEKIVEVVRTVEKEIPKVVERIVTVAPECSDLGDGFARLLNDQARAGVGGENDSADAAAEPDS